MKNFVVNFSEIGLNGNEPYVRPWISLGKYHMAFEARVIKRVKKNHGTPPAYDRHQYLLPEILKLPTNYVLMT